MFSSTIISHDFICPIPICQYGASWETVLDALQSSSCGTVAIANFQQKIVGVISRDRVFPLLASYWRNKTTVSASLEPNVYLEQLTPTQDYNSLLDPVSIININIESEKLLTYLRRDALIDQNPLRYLVVDTQERLLGLLDISKLLNFLLFESNYQELILSHFVSWEREIINLIERINLPLMLESSDGKICHRNSCWRELIEQNKHINNSETRGFRQDYAFYCLQSNINLISTVNLNKSSTSCHNSIVSFSKDNLNNNEINEVAFSPSKNQWQYIKMLISIDKLGNQLKSYESSKSYWLILASQELSHCGSNFGDAELIKINNLKDRLLADISHELKSPLTGIVGLSSLLKEEKIGKLNQRQISYVQLINQSSLKLIDIVSNLLELTNLTTGKFNLNLESIEIEPLCKQIYTQVINRLKEREPCSQGKHHSEAQKKALENSTQPKSQNLHFQLQIEPEVQVAIADKKCLSQILSHLLSIAVKSAPPQGKVGISVSPWDNWLGFTVWHEGETNAQFTSLGQSETTWSDQTNPIDLGAIIVQQLAKAHGGNISIIPRLHQKNEVTLLLPQNLNSFQITSDMTADNSSNNSLVLLVENELSYIDDVTLKIQDLGYHPLVARSGTEALQKARQFQPSYVLLNPILPILSGKDVLTLLKSDTHTQNIPIFVLNQGQDLDLYSQADGFIDAPIDALSLARILPGKNCPKTTGTNNITNITILCLYPEPEAIQQVDKNPPRCLDFHLHDWAEQDWANKNINGNLPNNYHYRIIEADGLEQAEMLARIWQLDVMIINNAQLKKPEEYLRSLQESPYLATLPLITLDAITTAAANKVKGLNVYPCLLPAESRNTNDLMEVIQIAARIN